MGEKILSAYERAVDSGLFNTDGAPDWATRDVRDLEARCRDLEGLRTRFDIASFPDDQIRAEQTGWLNESVDALVSYVSDIWEKVQSDHDLLAVAHTEYRREMAECV